MGNQETDITNEKFSNLKYKASTSAKNNYNILVITKHLEKYKYCISSNWCIGTSLKFSEKEGSWSLYSYYQRKWGRSGGGGCLFDIIVGAYSGKAAHKSMGTYSRNTVCYFKYTWEMFTTKADVELISLHQIRHKLLASMCTYY